MGDVQQNPGVIGQEGPFRHGHKLPHYFRKEIASFEFQA
jgi:hypothetical protein